MPTGMQTYGPDGTIYTNLTWTLSQMQGSVVTNAVNGSTTLPALPAGKSRFYIVVSLVDMQVWKGKRPGVTVSGNTMSWSYSFSDWFGQFAANCRIYYGYY